MKKNITPTPEGLYEGIVYRYLVNDSTSEDYGKSYIGNTTDENVRRSCWNKEHGNYGGRKIIEAKKMYGPDKWDYEVLETVRAETPEELTRKLNEREEYFILKYDSVSNGYNRSAGGTGNKGVEFDKAHKDKISRNHRKTQTKETRDKISASMKGHVQSAETRKKISEGNKGKKRTPEQKKVQSELRKGTVPIAATEGAKRWVKENRGGYWKNHTLPESAKENMKKAQQKRGIKVKVTYPDGSTKIFPTLVDAAKEFNVKAGSISYYISKGGIIQKNSCKFEAIDG